MQTKSSVSKVTNHVLYKAVYRDMVGAVIVAVDIAMINDLGGAVDNAVYNVVSRFVGQRVMSAMRYTTASAKYTPQELELVKSLL